MYFRIDVDEILHERIAFGIMEWLGVIGGISEFFLRIANFLMGGYLKFN